ncbi:MAG: CHRD domain-containing protein [Bacteroidota bacterium]
MKKIVHSLVTLACLTIGVNASKADHLADRLTFSARLQPAPGLTSTGNGVAAFMLNSTRDTLYFTISAAKLSSAITGYHIHNNRTGGNVIIDFDGKVLGNTVGSFLTGTQLSGLLNDFIQGNLYVAVHTTINPAVEILGFVKLESDWGFAASLDGTQAGTGSTAIGHAAINFGMKGDTATIRVATNLSNKINGVHLHFGKMGQSGAVALHLEDLIMADSISLVGGVSIAAADWTPLLASLMADSIYLNLHTAANPGGEIRGQLRSSKNLRFDAWLNSAAITAGGGTLAKPSMGYGVSTLWLNNSMDTLQYHVFFTGLTSPANAAHFHNAEANMSGGVVKEVTVVGGNMISGMWTKTDATNPLTPMLLSELLKGSLYFVVHTDSNPGGEIRGQVYRLAREGFIAELNGMQASTPSGAQGTAVASYDRDRTNLHSMVAFDGLQGTVTAGHIHFGKAGQAGAVAMDLDPFTNNGSYLYLKANNNFNNTTSIAMRRNDSSYVNIHTSSFANGEIRGQLMRYYRISSATTDTTTSTGVNEKLVNKSSLNVYPNPAAAQTQITFDSKVSGSATVVLYSITGAKVLTLTQAVQAGNNNYSIDLSNLNNGIYFISLSINGESVSNHKLMKN